ncbi:hypothetical protein [Haloferax larsenii]|uniref:hypothetical protein n=1 Tax=Haloferax larsenii TaxID=302484 RepID=UPI0011141AC7|nr:hypothetical protein [Haloferax larsenii]
MRTTTTIDGEILEKLGDLKLMLREIGSTRHFKGDIVQNSVDELYDEVRSVYYEQKAQPFVLEYRNQHRSDLLDYWTDDRIRNELVNETYQEKYRELYGDLGGQMYLEDIRAALVDTHDSVSRWLRPELVSGAFKEEMVLYCEGTETSPSVFACTLPIDAFYFSLNEGRVPKAIEHAREAVSQLAAQTLRDAGNEMRNPLGKEYLLVETPEYWKSLPEY